jgi:NAD(P)-dependent dehydrogenase (short-subunit alcohol dehydrogenase family)
VAVLTGCTTGIGLEVAAALSACGIEVWAANRGTMERGEATCDAIHKRAQEIHAGRGGTHVVPRPIPFVCDVGDLTSVQKFADTVIEKLRHERKFLRLCVMNAAVLGTPYRVGPQGVDQQIATNTLGPILLMERLAPALAFAARAVRPSESSASPLFAHPNAARVVVVSSFTMLRSVLSPELVQRLLTRADANLSTVWDAYSAYPQSKALLFHHALSLQRRLAGFGVAVRHYHPGSVATNIITHVGRGGSFWATLQRIFRKVLALIEPADSATYALRACFAFDAAHEAALAQWLNANEPSPFSGLVDACDAASRHSGVESPSNAVATPADVLRVLDEWMFDVHHQQQRMRQTSNDRSNVADAVRHIADRIAVAAAADPARWTGVADRSIAGIEAMIDQVLAKEKAHLFADQNYFVRTPWNPIEVPRLTARQIADVNTALFSTLAQCLSA